MRGAHGLQGRRDRAKWKSFITHLECSETGAHYPADRLATLSETGKPLLVRYDLAAARTRLTREVLATRPAGLWRWRELLPVRHPEDIISLGEMATPLLPLARTSAGVPALVKDEGRLPTGSVKARGFTTAVSVAKAFNVRHLAMSTNGNAGSALAAYASRAGIRATIFCPEDTPDVTVSEIAAQGATVYRVNGVIDDCGGIVANGVTSAGWFDLSTLKEPYRIEGEKTMGFELAEQLGWNLPDVIFYPTGGGTGLIGMWKAFAELEAIGLIDARRPRMVAVQAAGCAPVVRAFEQGAAHAKRWEGACTVAAGIRVPHALGDSLILRTIRESRGFAVAVPDDAIITAQEEVGQKEGVLLCPEGAATFAAWRVALTDGRVKPHELVVLFNCATGLKYPLLPAGIRIDHTAPINYTRFASGR